MNIINVIIKEFKQTLRDRRAMILMVLFPIVLILLLGNALSNNDMHINAKVLYSIKGNGEDVKYFKDFQSSLEKDKLVKFVEFNKLDSAVKKVKNIEYDCAIVYDSEKRNIQLYKNDKFNLSGSIVETIINDYVMEYNKNYQIAKVAPQKLTEIMKGDNNDFVNIRCLNSKRQPTALDYYSITMISMMILYGSIYSAGSITSEIYYKTSHRLLSTPMKKWQLLTGKVIGNFGITFFQMFLVLLCSKYVLNGYWGNDMISILLIFMAESFMAVSVGIGISFIVKNPSTMEGLLSILIPFLVFIAGGYTDSVNKIPIVKKIAWVSPVKWVNQSMFNIIYDNNYSIFSKTIFLNLAIAGIFIFASALLYRKEE